MKNLSPEEIAKMNIYQKLKEARVRFLEAGTKKSGVNNHAEFLYFELEDIVPAAEKIFDDLGLLFLVTFQGDTAYGTLYNTDAPVDTLTISAPLRSIAEPAKYRMNETQAAGAEITYYRRYLYMLLLDIVEADKIDAGEGRTEEAKVRKTEEKKTARKKPPTKEERAEIKETVTAADEPAGELQVEALRLALSKLLALDPDQENFIQQVMIQTEGLTKITKEQAERLVTGISKMLAQYEEAE